MTKPFPQLPSPCPCPGPRPQQAAAALAPERLIHRVELGRTYLKLGRRAEALEQLAASVEMDVEDINAALQKQDAQELLAKLRGEAFQRGVGPLSLAWGAGASGSGGGSGGSGGGGSGGNKLPGSEAPSGGAAGAA